LCYHLQATPTVALIYHLRRDIMGITKTI